MQAPLQPAKVEPHAAVAVRVTAVPLARVAEQVDVQLMPPVLEVTVPLPVPFFATARAKVVETVEWVTRSSTESRSGAETV